ncbi:MAG: hypothetical protein ACREC9_07725 [Methylocella sp.]
MQSTGNDRRQSLATLLGAGIAGAALRAAGPARTATAKMAPVPDDELFIGLAIAQAAMADFPFGAVIVRTGKILATGRNLGKTPNDPTAHGAMVAIRRVLVRACRAPKLSWAAATCNASLSGRTGEASGELSPGSAAIVASLRTPKISAQPSRHSARWPVSRSKSGDSRDRCLMR